MKLVPALLLVLLPFSSGCAGLLTTELEPVFTPALWRASAWRTELATARTVEGPRPVALRRAARTGDGVWHVLARLGDGTERHLTCDPAHPALRAEAPEQVAAEMARWTSPACFAEAPPLQPCPGPWPEEALQLPVLVDPGAALPARALEEAVLPGEDEGPGTVLRLAPDARELEAWTPEGWRPLARYWPERHTVPASQPPDHPRTRVVLGAVKAALTPASLALDAGWLGALGTGKLAAITVGVPALLIVLACGGWR